MFSGDGCCFLAIVSYSLKLDIFGAVRLAPNDDEKGGLRGGPQGGSIAAQQHGCAPAATIFPGIYHSFCNEELMLI
jgi:hypothetical protein